jgi:PhnB protein
MSDSNLQIVVITPCNKPDAHVGLHCQSIYQSKPKIMSSVSTYLNFSRQTEAAFNFYKSVFGGDFTGPVMRFKDVPQQEGTPAMAEDDLQLVMHIELRILGSHTLMGTDAPETMGFQVRYGNNMYINLQPDTRKETKQLFDALASGGKVTMELQDMFWGDYFGTCIDQFGVQWMFNCGEK